METFTHDGCEWYINDTRGYLDAGPACDECGACDCSLRTCHPSASPAWCSEGTRPDHRNDGECIGLSVAYVCLDGGDALCEDCAAKAGITEDE